MSPTMLKLLSGLIAVATTGTICETQAQAQSLPPCGAGFPPTYACFTANVVWFATNDAIVKAEVVGGPNDGMIVGVPLTSSPTTDNSQIASKLSAGGSYDLIIDVGPALSPYSDSSYKLVHGLQNPVNH